jgi:phosphomannomutase
MTAPFALDLSGRTRQTSGMRPLRVSGCGLRGFVGDTLSPQVVMDIACAFGTWLEGGTVWVGSDTRDSSPMLARAVKAGLMSCGCNVLDAGVCPAPVLQQAAPRRQAAGAVAISGGHHGMGWNAVTLIGPDGALLDPVTGEGVLDLYHAGDFRRADWQGVGSDQPLEGLFEPYLDALELVVDGEAIRRAGYTVVIDPVGGAGTPYIRPFADRFGLRLVGIHAQASGYLPREPEPRPRSAQHIAAIIGHVDGDVGFVHSSDMGRTSLVSETGEPASEEYTLTVVARHWLRRRPGTVVTNCCTSRMLDRVAAEAGVALVKTRVGQAQVLAAVADEEAVLGGEGSGSVVLPAFSLGYDGFLVMALVLDAMAAHDAPLSTLLAQLPKLHIVKRRRACDARAAYHAVDVVRQRLLDAGVDRMDLTDGVRIDRDDGWVHVRPSQTEQLIRVISEAGSRERAELEADRVTRMLEEVL